MKIAENNIVELTWWDEYDSKESTEISVYTECLDGSGDVWVQVGGMSLSIVAWEMLMLRIQEIVEIKGLQDFIDRHKVVEGEIEVISKNKIRWIKPAKPLT